MDVPEILSSKPVITESVADLSFRLREIEKLQVLKMTVKILFKNVSLI